MKNLKKTCAIALTAIAISTSALAFPPMPPLPGPVGTGTGGVIDNRICMTNPALCAAPIYFDAVREDKFYDCGTKPVSTLTQCRSRAQRCSSGEDLPLNDGACERDVKLQLRFYKPNNPTPTLDRFYCNGEKTDESTPCPKTPMPMPI